MNSNNNPFRSIKRTRVVEEVIEVIRQALMNDELRPGDRLPTEAELTEQLSVGRNAIREAMKMLSALGVVEIRQGDGTYVADEPSSSILNPLVFAILMKTKTTKELTELRATIEIGYCQLAAENATPDDMELILEAAEAWETHARGADPDVDQLTQLDLDFHRAIINATHNSLVVTLACAVEELFLSSVRGALSKPEVLKWGTEGHRRIVASLKKRNLEAIRQAVLHSLACWSRELGGETHDSTT